MIRKMVVVKMVRVKMVVRKMITMVSLVNQRGDKKILRALEMKFIQMKILRKSNGEICLSPQRKH